MLGWGVGERSGRLGRPQRGEEGLWSPLRPPRLPGSGRSRGREAWVQGGGDPGQDAAGVQQGHGGRPAGSGWLQDGAESRRAQTRRRGLRLEVRTATSPGEARAAGPEPCHSGPWRPERASQARVEPGGRPAPESAQPGPRGPGKWGRLCFSRFVALDARHPFNRHGPDPRGNSHSCHFGRWQNAG